MRLSSLRVAPRAEGDALGLMLVVHIASNS
jgi:hypothetical protein